jgi:hypothetical protein
MSDEKRKLKINIPELISAFEMGSVDTPHYLDIETGEVIPDTSENIGIELNEILEEFNSIHEDSSTEESAAYKNQLIEFIKQCDKQDWVKAEATQAVEIESGFGSRYIAIPWVESRDGYRDMELFIDMVEDEHLQELLSVAINGRGAFRRFKDVLYNHLDERERWFAFKNERTRQRALDWLDDEGIEMVE